MASENLGRFLWYDLMTSDPAAAQAFYGSVMGWGTEAFEGGPEPYDMWTRDGQPLGGLMQLPEEAVAAGAPPHWLAYIGTPDVDATSARAGDLGASRGALLPGGRALRGLAGGAPRRPGRPVLTRGRPPAVAQTQARTAITRHEPGRSPVAAAKARG